MAWDAERGPRVAVLGTGAQGASLGADFALAGHDVTFIDQWPENITAIRENGITVQFPTRSINVNVPALHLCELAEFREPFDLVFIVVKAYDTKWACQLIEPYLHADSVVVGMQNGMTHEEIAAIVGPQRTMGGVIVVAASMFEPGVAVRDHDHDISWYGLGAYGPEVAPRVEFVADMLRKTGRVEIQDDIRSAKWMKLVLNTAELIPTAIIDHPLLEASRAPGMLEIMRAAAYETMDAALAAGANIVPIMGTPPMTKNHPHHYVDQIIDQLLNNFTQPNILTTSLQDWRKGRRSEIREIHGWVADTLHAHGRSAPVNQIIIDMALEIERGERKPDRANLGVLRKRFEGLAG